MQAVRDVFFCIVLLCCGACVWARATSNEPCLADDRDSLQHACDDKYHEEYDHAMELDSSEMTTGICCALESFEQCSLDAYYKSGCVGEMGTLKESLKAARLFASILTNITCAEFRGRCSSADDRKPTLWLFILALYIALIYAGKMIAE